ncbi:hypothetical protein D1BOALGB6SA_518 [Olavius sp. associated proteobacterium Delta 1]|nr:hypothetical protein D1BOALGB6SA_518 [Olavius sp. associated proteobacterium Delta 1]
MRKFNKQQRLTIGLTIILLLVLPQVLRPKILWTTLEVDRNLDLIYFLCLPIVIIAVGVFVVYLYRDKDKGSSV